MSVRSEQIRSAMQGDHEAFIWLVSTEKEKLRRIARYYVRNEMDAEDIVQDATVRAYCSLHRLRSLDAFDGWLTRITVNCALSHLSKQKRIYLTDDPHTDMKATAPVHDYDQALDLEQAIRDLEPRLQQLVYLKYMQDLTQQQIAELLDQPLGTVKTSLRKGLKQLRQALNQDQPLNSRTTSTNLLEKELIAMRTRLKQQAESLYTIPAEYELLIEDYKETSFERHSDGEAHFVWMKPGMEKGVAITLSTHGKLLDFAVNPAEDQPHLERTNEQLQVNAEQFIEDHHPGILASFPHMETERREDDCLFIYQQTAMELPLPLTGCYVMVDLGSGQVTSFRYYGEVDAPVIPSKLHAPSRLLDDVLHKLRMNLQYLVLSEGVFTDGDDKAHLVYAPSIYRFQYSADAADEIEIEPESSIDKECYASIDAELLNEIHALELQERSAQEWAGVDPEQYELVRESELSETVKSVVWQRKERTNKPAADDRSWDAYFSNHSGDTIKAKLDRKTDRLLEFMCFSFDRKLSGKTVKWNRQACLRTALIYIRALTPDLLPYLQLIEGETEPDSALEHFQFALFLHGIPVPMEYVYVSVNRTSGVVERFNTTHLKVGELEGLERQPEIAEQEAIRMFLDNQEFQLKWDVEYTQEENPRRLYKLNYHLTNRMTGRKPRVLDALTGRLFEALI